MYKPFLVEAIRLEFLTQHLLDEWDKANQDVVLRHTSSSGIKHQQKLIQTLIDLTILFSIKYRDMMDKGVSRIVLVKSRQCLNESMPLLKEINDTVAIEGFVRELHRLAEDHAEWRKFRSGKYNLSFDDRLKGIVLSTTRTLKNIITLSAKRGFGSKELTKVLHDYINPHKTPEKPFDIAREALGASKAFRPKNVLAGSVQSNLYALTRDEASEFWRNLTDRIYKNTDWVKGFRWELSSSHIKCGCVCEAHAKHGMFKRDEERPKSHPNCLCDWVPVLMSPAEASKLLKSRKTLYNSN
jgi:hypothetical protein